MFKKIFAVIILSVSYMVSSAPGDVTAKIARVAALNGAVYIKTNPRPSPKPACATNASYDFAFSLSDETGKATLSMALSAYAAKSTVTVKAQGSCTVHGAMDDLKYLILE